MDSDGEMRLSKWVNDQLEQGIEVPISRVYLCFTGSSECYVNPFAVKLDADA